jgi:FixJ family two-component response regulator
VASALSRVFLIDDDASVRKALHRLLRAAGYEVEAFDGACAFLARAAPVLPACLVLDIRMPGMSGIDLQKAIQGTSHDLPIIFITGHGDEDERHVAVASGAIDVLPKPLDQDVLIEAIERGLKRCRAHQSTPLG